MTYVRRTGDGRVYRVPEDVHVVEANIPRSEPFRIVTNSPYLMSQIMVVISTTRAIRVNKLMHDKSFVGEP